MVPPHQRTLFTVLFRLVLSPADLNRYFPKQATLDRVALTHPSNPDASAVGISRQLFSELSRDSQSGLKALKAFSSPEECHNFFAVFYQFMRECFSSEIRPTNEQVQEKITALFDPAIALSPGGAAAGVARSSGDEPAHGSLSP